MSQTSRPFRLPVWIREVIITVLLAAAIMAVVGVFQREGQRGGGGDLPTGTEAEPFALSHALDGTVWRLADLRGKPVILNFWATWCGVCRTDMPELEALWRGAEGRFHLVTISSEMPAVLARFARERSLTLPILSDPTGRTLERYDVNAFPTVVILDRDGKIVHDFEGSAHTDILAEHMRKLSDVPP